MKRVMVLIIFFISVVMAYAETENNASNNANSATNTTDNSITCSANSTTDTTGNSATHKVKYISTFQDDYSKPKSNDDQSQDKNEAAQNTTTTTGQAVKQTNAQAKEEIAAPGKVLVSK